MKKFFRTSLWILLALLAAGTFFFLWQNSRPRHDRYESVVPAFDTIERTTVLTGTIEPRDEIQIKPQISGIIAEIAVEPGDQVRIVFDGVMTASLPPQISAQSICVLRVY